MRKLLSVLACALLSTFAFADAVLADGGNNKGGFAVRQPSGPADSKLFGKESAPSESQGAAGKPGSPAAMNAAAGNAPPAAPIATEEAAPIAPVATQPLDEKAAPQSLFGDQPVWDNRWFWALLAILLFAAAGAVEYFGRKRDEALAADEPDDALLKA